MCLMADLSPCIPPQTHLKKSWPYQEYYVEDRNDEQQKNVDGSYHWTGAESLEWYTGHLLHNTMHGIGEYHCRHRDEPNVGLTYEGHFYNNYMHGYGVTSYMDGNVFTGVYHSNLRWGPGVESDLRLNENVGFWKGTKLIRLSWRPNTHSVIPDLMSTQIGRDLVAQKRSLLIEKRQIIGQINPAIEILKQYGADPLTASLNWTKLYPNNCTDENSKLFNTINFDRVYYCNNEILSLEDYLQNTPKDQEVTSKSSSTTNGSSNTAVPNIFYTWNNNKMMTHMMKHCYKHETQRRTVGLNLNAILSGPRCLFKPAADHELNCSYLGHIQYVAQLINEHGINVNVADMQGNSALMYAACGNQPDIIHFLVEAGAQINDFNDACCTPLGIVLINYACSKLGILPLDVIQYILPLTVEKNKTVDQYCEWKIERDLAKRIVTSIPNIWGSRATNSAQGTPTKKSEHIFLKKSKSNITSKTSITEEYQNKLFKKLEKEFMMTVDNMLKGSLSKDPKYIFEVNDMVKEINSYYGEETDKNNRKISKAKNNDISQLKLLELELFSTSQATTFWKNEQSSKSMMPTITQLLLDGADPRRVHCPQPALFLAVVIQNADLIRELVKHGANVNEVYSDTLGYTPIDIAISRSLTRANLEVIQALLEVGAKVDHRLLNNEVDNTNASVSNEGPTLLHAVLAKENNHESDEAIRQLIPLLLTHGCNPLTQYKGLSAMHMTLFASSDIFDLFIENPNTNLNGIINNSNQSILMKMFEMTYYRSNSVAEWRRKLTNLLLYGADPLLKCENDKKAYENLFVYAKDILSKQEQLLSSLKDAEENKSKIDVKKKKISVSSLKSVNKSTANGHIANYKQALDQTTDCTRLLFIRWIQTKLLKELIEVVERFKQRHWNMILKEYKNGTSLRLWLSPVRCLEIWDIIQTTNKRIYNDKKIKKYVLCIVVYYCKNKKKVLRWALSAEDKLSIELEAAYFVREHSFMPKVDNIKRPYVTPELTPTKEIGKFNICFECALPLKENNIRCYKCKQVSFCSLACIEINVDRDNCHPCSNYLKKKYFPIPKVREVKLAE